ncbi:MAG TPA: hypothetical protein VFS39_15330 [Nitrospira sp.]|nr:hypothetical protein [Nitrospira sp.]
MRRTVLLGVALSLTVLLAACSSYRHHHGMKGGAGGDAYWQKGREDMAELIGRTVKDPEKAKQANAISDEVIAELKKSTERERQHHRELYQLNADYQAMPEAFMKIMDEANNERMRSASKVLGLRFKMKELMTPEEWKALTDEMAKYGARYQGRTEGAPGY